MLSALLIAMLTAITVWWLLIQRLKDKPWTKQGVVPTSQESFTSSAPKVGLWVFLAVVSSLFGLFASAYMMRVGGHAGLVVWQPLDEPNILWINTLVLVLASGAMQIARNRIDADDFAGQLDELLSWFRERNRFARLRVHVIAMGNTGVDLDYLAALARQNDGQFLHLTGTH